jgi:hypothetical protein
VYSKREFSFSFSKRCCKIILYVAEFCKIFRLLWPERFETIWRFTIESPLVTAKMTTGTGNQKILSVLKTDFFDRSTCMWMTDFSVTSIIEPASLLGF